MSNSIKQFDGRNDFLSNFYKCFAYSPLYDEIFPSVENAYQAAKNNDINWVGFCKTCTPHEAKVQSRSVPLRHDWEVVKIDLMFRLVEAKFMRNETLKKRLLKLEDVTIIEGNTWNDTFWGVDLKTMRGSNVLGQILMLILERMIVRDGFEKVEVKKGLEIYIDKYNKTIIQKIYPSGTYTVSDFNLEANIIKLTHNESGKKILHKDLNKLTIELNNSFDVLYNDLHTILEKHNSDNIQTLIKEWS